MNILDKEEPKPVKYNFYVNSAEEVDIPRIIRENPEAQALVITSSSSDALLLIRKELLARANFDDDVARIPSAQRATDGRLYSAWGDQRIGYAQQNTGISFAITKQLLDGFDLDARWRADVIHKSQIPAAIEALRKLASFQRRIEVRVSQLV